uniref:Uncharacterized protein n=1 Tax=Fagus sylvatica TaxID=28930 RepID=A0A2N9FAQ1_FAGSY
MNSTGLSRDGRLEVCARQGSLMPHPPHLMHLGCREYPLSAFKSLDAYAPFLVDLPMPQRESTLVLEKPTSMFNTKRVTGAPILVISALIAFVASVSVLVLRSAPYVDRLLKCSFVVSRLTPLYKLASSPFFGFYFLLSYYLYFRLTIALKLLFCSLRYHTNLGAWHYPNHRCPTEDRRPAEKRKKPKKHLTNFAALQIVYNSEDLAAARANIENQATPAHDIQHMSGINIKNLLPPPRVQVEASGSTLPGDIRKRKRKGSSKGETSRPEPQVNLEVPRTEAPQSGVDDLSPAIQPGIELDLSVPNKGPGPSKEPAPLWAPFFLVYGDPVRSDATVLRTGGTGSNTASALSEVACLLADMAREKLEESLRTALEANSQAEERIKALEAEMAEREKAAFDRGRALFAWPETKEIPLLPPRENLPYPDVQIGVPEEEVQEPLPQPLEEGNDVPPSD